MGARQVPRRHARRLGQLRHRQRLGKAAVDQALRPQHRRVAVARVGTLLTGIGALGVDSISSDFGIFEFSAEELEALRATVAAVAADGLYDQKPINRYDARPTPSHPTYSPR